MFAEFFYIEKETATPADTLVAFGLAQLLDVLIPKEVGDIGLRLEDTGDCYRLALKTPILPEWVTQASFFPLLIGLDTAKKQASLPQSQRVDYIRHQERNQAYFNARQKGLSEEDLNAQGLTPPHRDWPAWAIVNQMSAINTYNSLAELWYEHHHCFPPLMQIILELYSGRPNDLEVAIAAWKQLAKDEGIVAKAVVPRLQVINPGMGKGGNKSKASGLSIGGLAGFWLIEYLKFAGLFQATLPRSVKGSKDRKTYVLRPKALYWYTHKAVFPKFQEGLFANSAVKMDILATLHYCRVFLEQWKAGQGSSHFAFIQGNPGDHVAALETVYYKHLGSAHATMNLSTLVLPLWLPEITSEEEAQRYIELLSEHTNIIRNLDENKGDEYRLLYEYRDFLSGRDLLAFYRFTRGYSGFIMRKLAAVGPSPRQFTIPNLEVLIMAHNRELSPILQDEGFQHVAEAIRRSTVIPQYQKARGRDSLYEIRYGLGDKLLRHAQYSDDFAQELSLFMHDYNRENARKSETRGQQYRSNLTTEDIVSIVNLIDTYGSATVANLLVAFGYARDPNIGSRETLEPTEELA